MPDILSNLHSRAERMDGGRLRDDGRQRGKGAENTDETGSEQIEHRI